jgi:hypothetical protein
MDHSIVSGCFSFLVADQDHLKVLPAYVHLGYPSSLLLLRILHRRTRSAEPAEDGMDI